MMIFFCYSINYLICNIIVINCMKREREICGYVEGPKEARSLWALLWVNTALTKMPIELWHLNLYSKEPNIRVYTYSKFYVRKHLQKST